MFRIFLSELHQSSSIRTDTLAFHLRQDRSNSPTDDEVHKDQGHMERSASSVAQRSSPQIPEKVCELDLVAQVARTEPHRDLVADRMKLIVEDGVFGPLLLEQTNPVLHTAY